MVKAKKIKENRWRASVYLGKDDYGRKKYKDIYGTSEKECNSKVIQFLYEKENNLLENDIIEKSTLKTIEDFYDEWLENRLDIRATTKKEYISIKKCHLSPLMKMPIKDLKNSTLKKFYKELYDKTNANTTKKVSKLFNCFLKNMITDKRTKLRRDILDNITLPKSAKKKPYFVTNELYNEFITILKDEYQKDSDIGYLYILILICAGCGLRIGEALAIEIEDINLKDSTIRINKEVTFEKGKGYYVIEATKSGSGDRIVVMPQKIKEVVMRHIAILNIKQNKINKNINNTYLYVDKNNIEYQKSGYKLLISSEKFGLIPKNTAQRNWKNFREKLGYTEQIRIHDMRRFQATLLRDNNVPEEVAKLQMGHSDTTMTRYYQNTDTSTLINYISDIDIPV